MLVDALQSRIENHNFPFNHWTTDQPLSELAIDEVYGVNLGGRLVTLFKSMNMLFCGFEILD